MERVVIKVYGLVQGVLFRFETQRLAQKLGLRGWVRNEPDGTVLIITEGERENLEKLIDWAHHGPPTAQVEKVEVTWQKPKGEFKNFSINW